MRRMIIPPHIRNVIPHLSEDHRIDDLLSEATDTILSGDELTTHVRSHSHADVMQHLYDNADDSEELENALLSLQTANREQHDFIVARINKLIARAATEYVKTLKSEIVESDRRMKNIEMESFLSDQYENDADYHL